MHLTSLVLTEVMKAIFRTETKLAISQSRQTFETNKFMNHYFNRFFLVFDGGTSIVTVCWWQVSVCMLQEETPVSQCRRIAVSAHARCCSPAAYYTD